MQTESAAGVFLVIAGISFGLFRFSIHLFFFVLSVASPPGGQDIDTTVKPLSKK